MRYQQSILLALLLCGCCLLSSRAAGQQNANEDEIVANLAGGRVIVHVTGDNIVFGAVNHPLEAKSVPPRVVELDSTHVGVLLGASEWQLPAEPNPVRLDRDFRRIMARDPRYQKLPGEEPDLEAIGISFLDRLRPLVSQLHHKIDLGAEEPLFEIVVIGFAPEQYGPEVWLVEYRVEQQEVATRVEYWQTRLLRPRFTQLYPPEKHQPRTLVEVRYPADQGDPPLAGLIQANDTAIARLRGSDVRFAKVIEQIDKGQAQKANPTDAANFLRTVLPLIAGKETFFMANFEQQQGFSWIVPPDEPFEKATEDKNRPPDAPTLRRKPKP
jgi:hypothetical protein